MTFEQAKKKCHTLCMVCDEKVCPMLEEDVCNTMEQSRVTVPIRRKYAILLLLTFVLDYCIIAGHLHSFSMLVASYTSIDCKSLFIVFGVVIIICQCILNIAIFKDCFKYIKHK